jgi:hypothetical protein
LLFHRWWFGLSVIRIAKAGCFSVAVLIDVLGLAHQESGKQKTAFPSGRAVIETRRDFCSADFSRCTSDDFRHPNHRGISPSPVGSTGFYPNAFLMSSKCNRAHRHAARRSCVIEKLLSWSIFKTPHLFHLTHLAPLAREIEALLQCCRAKG